MVLRQAILISHSSQQTIQPRAMIVGLHPHSQRRSPKNSTPCRFT